MYSILEVIPRIWQTSWMKKSTKRPRTQIDDIMLVTVSSPSMILIWNPEKVANWGSRATNSPFQSPLKEAFMILILSLLQNIEPTFRAIVMARNIIERMIYPEMLKNRIPDKLYFASWGLAEEESDGVIISRTILKKSNLELNML